MQNVLTQTFMFMGALVLCGVSYKILEGNYSMVAPHLKTLYAAGRGRGRCLRRRGDGGAG